MAGFMSDFLDVCWALRWHGAVGAAMVLGAVLGGAAGSRQAKQSSRALPDSAAAAATAAAAAQFDEHVESAMRLARSFARPVSTAQTNAAETTVPETTQLPPGGSAVRRRAGQPGQAGHARHLHIVKNH